MTPAELTRLLAGCYAEKRALRERHEEAARLVRDYDANNTYQQILAREDAHLTWLAEALEAMGSPLPERSEPAVPAPAGGSAAALFEADARHIAAFLDRWREPVGAVTHARHRQMLNVVLGEMAEQKRFFEQAAAGRADLLGRRTGGPRLGGEVLATRWVE